MPLLRILGLGFGLAVVVGASIGSGILRAPGAVVAQTGSSPIALFVWTLGGVYALLGAACLAELATSIPRSGGFYVYARRALGDGFGFAVGWADWFNNCAAVSYGAVTAAEYAGLLAPALVDHGSIVAGAVILAFALLQLCGMRVSSRAQELASVVKASVFVALIGAIFLLAEPAPRAAAVPSSLALPTIVTFVLALRLVVGAYDGWQSGMYFAGEDRDPTRNLPRALIGGVVVVMAVYLLMNLALIRALPIAELAESALPVADAARAVMGERGETAITFISLLSPLSNISAVLLCAPRILYAIGSDGLAPRGTAFVDQGGTPSVSLVISTAVALALLATGGFESIATVFAFFAVTSYAGAFVSLLVLRRREPDLPRPFQAWGYPWTPLLVLAGAIALLIGLVTGAPRQSMIAAGALIASYPVYRFTRRGGRG